MLARTNEHLYFIFETLQCKLCRQKVLNIIIILLVHCTKCNIFQMWNETPKRFYITVRHIPECINLLMCRNFNSCVGFDSGCVRRQMNNFVHDLISPNHDGESKNLTIWGQTLYLQDSARPLEYPIFILTSGGTSGEKNFSKNFYCTKSCALKFQGDLWGSKSQFWLI